MPGRMKFWEQLSVIGTKCPSIARFQYYMILNNIPTILLFKLRIENGEPPCGRNNFSKNVCAGVRVKNYNNILFPGVYYIPLNRGSNGADVCVIKDRHILFLGADERFLNRGSMRNKRFWQSFVISGTMCAFSGSDVRISKYNKDIHVPNR